MLLPPLNLRYQIIYFNLILLASCSYNPISEILRESSSEIEINDELQLSPRKENSDYEIPKNASAIDNLLSRASALLAEKNYEAASSIVERAMRLGPDDPRAYFSLAQIRFQQGFQEQAKILIQKAEVLSENQPELLSFIRKYKNILQKKY